ncbi:SGNH/GDSL hydrolase family protein [Paeniglutamicibacter sulfureus]|uniref:SGNH/GDSL hydrolase family protein n=2 Tax=Paeniglutamicibacter TaxID=1742990 RepID=UPI0026670873|nr:SGNH/GDSL hydrolase family protein [Paeniglutamicibacter sulfureus]MDO2934048.1 SGNH/GDSL hydrolase family protein [Paeniglutamicibacter sulfureus]
MGTRKPFLILACMAVFVGLLGLSGMPRADEPLPQAFAVPAGVNHNTFMVAGDSITAAGSRKVAVGHVGEASWVRYVNTPGTPATLAWTGGWALGGAQSGDMAVALRAGSADSLVILAGTNDLAHGNSHTMIGENLARIARIVRAPMVLLSSIPPRDDAVAATVAYNEFLKTFAGERGWTYVDASAGLRSEANTFIEGLSDDGVHPNVEGAKILGAAIGQALTTKPMQAIADTAGVEPLG